ncbi:hypothetical protein EGR_11212 [Echinococcus granulosus]|uniref:Uncharacterized protein n=1 Tax=Echinococcus granulosus TaxID=6210 RepID=W6U0E6_ECHGR|nr:hypothetical protein EGR_11212 [Echinococcus granulosus]EUB53931.1 hypothetical protein EGR_11212 [Echinococcus granulosus]
MNVLLTVAVAKLIFGGLTETSHKRYELWTQWCCSS